MESSDAALSGGEGCGEGLVLLLGLARGEARHGAQRRPQPETGWVKTESVDIFFSELGHVCACVPKPS